MSTLKFRVLLDSATKEEVFRDILIDEKNSFEDLYNTIIQSFGFSGNQLASFYISNEDWDRGEEIGLLDMNYATQDDEQEAIQQMKDTTLKSKMEDKDQKVILVYDFLKMWIFLIELQETLPQSIKKPEIALSIGVAPNESDKSDDFMMEGEGGFEDDEEEDYFDDMDEFDEEDFSEGFEIDEY